VAQLNLGQGTAGHRKFREFWGVIPDGRTSINKTACPIAGRPKKLDSSLELNSEAGTLYDQEAQTSGKDHEKRGRLCCWNKGTFN
jgi:hypothetical protein